MIVWNSNKLTIIYFKRIQNNYNHSIKRGDMHIFFNNKYLDKV